jgi:hypothetical protein
VQAAADSLHAEDADFVIGDVSQLMPVVYTVAEEPAS